MPVKRLESAVTYLKSKVAGGIESGAGITLVASTILGLALTKIDRLIIHTQQNPKKIEEWTLFSDPSGDLHMGFPTLNSQGREIYLEFGSGLPYPKKKGPFILD